MAHLNVVFDPEVPQAERIRLLSQYSSDFMPSDSDAAEYLVEVPQNQQLQIAQKIAELEYNGKVAITYVEYTRPLREIQEPTSH